MRSSRALSPVTDPHPAGQDEGLGPRPAFDEATLHEQLVEALAAGPGHRAIISAPRRAASLGRESNGPLEVIERADCG